MTKEWLGRGQEYELCRSNIAWELGFQERTNVRGMIDSEIPGGGPDDVDHVFCRLIVEPTSFLEFLLVRLGEEWANHHHHCHRCRQPATGIETFQGVSSWAATSSNRVFLSLISSLRSLIVFAGSTLTERGLIRLRRHRTNSGDYQPWCCESLKKG